MRKKQILSSFLIGLFLLQSSVFAQEFKVIENGKYGKSQPQKAKAADDVPSVNKPEFDTDAYSKIYKKVTKDGVVMQAMELMNTVSIAQYSYNALMGNNLTGKPFKIEFKYLEDINPEYESFDALGWKKKGVLHIYINNKHRNAPPEALAALLAHEAIHQDEFASLNEETYAWTLEAATWMKLTEKNPSAVNSASTLVTRENMLKKLFEKGDYTSKYIKKAVYTNPGYSKLPTRSPGFEDEDL